MVVLQQLLMCLSARTKTHLALSRLAVKRQENQQSFISTRALCAIYNRCSLLFSFFSEANRLLWGVAFLFPPKTPGSWARRSSIEVVVQKNIVFEFQTLTGWTCLSFMPPHTIVCFAWRQVFVTKLLGWSEYLSIYLASPPLATNQPFPIIFAFVLCCTHF